MTVTENLVTDLLPVYFSGDASADTRRVVEEFFHEHPAFERSARHAAAPVQVLDRQEAASADTAREMADFAAARRAIRRARVWFSMGVLFTIMPLSFGFTIASGRVRLDWLMLRDNPSQALVAWVWAAFAWWMYLRRR